MSKEPGLSAMPEDLQAIRAWFGELAVHVNALDFAGSRHLTREDFLAFGTVANFVAGRAAAEANQWRKVWPTIDNFRFRLDDVRAFVSPDRLFAVGLAVFDSTGYREDGTAYERPGRATISFDRKRIGDPWVANHSHMSLFRDVPQISHGKKTAKG